MNNSQLKHFARLRLQELVIIQNSYYTLSQQIDWRLRTFTETEEDRLVDVIVNVHLEMLERLIDVWYKLAYVTLKDY